MRACTSGVKKEGVNLIPTSWVQALIWPEGLESERDYRGGDHRSFLPPVLQDARRLGILLCVCRE